MSEVLRNGSEPFENERELNSGDITELAIKGLSRITGERNDNAPTDDDGDYDADNDGYHSEEAEWHYGEECADFDEENLTLWEFAVPKEILERYAFLGELPGGIAVMGGVARSIAREMITGEREPIRDIDLVNITDEDGNSNVDADTIDRLSHEYMPDDYAFGHGIGDDTMEHYFKSRDFTINQCLIMDGKLIVSDYAYNDFQENIIRPTYFEQPYTEETTSSRLFLKALIMRSVLLQISDSIPLIEDMEPPEEVSSFNIALFLNKAMSRGARTALTFTEDLADWDIIPERYAGRPIALAKWLLGDVDGFEFRPSTDERFKDVQECDDMSGFFVPPAMAHYHASNPTIRRALAEYDDGLGILLDSEQERTAGHYTQTEYDNINHVQHSGSKNFD